ncbi:hypothetical protein WJX74_000619 [Apatococcus lobatus]|uniref:Recombinase A n=1 Tax=Apatococcus lobatus TaxID=904363 RepID=A0AAW1RRM0_9CHLO
MLSGPALLPHTSCPQLAYAGESAPLSPHMQSLKASGLPVGASNKAALALEKSLEKEKESKARVLEGTLSELNARFGKGSIMRLGSQPEQKVATIPSGSLTLDIALGGGIPRGRIIEIYGPESSGKTTLALHAIAEVQKQGGTAVLIDAEHAFDVSYAKKLGVDTDGMLLCQPDSGEMALEVADQLVRSQSVDIIAVDSVAALVPRSEIEGEIGNLQLGAQARLMSQAMRKVTANASKCGCTVIMLNQLRQKIGIMFGNPEVTSGGQALKFYASVRIDVRRKATIEGTKGEMVGIKVKAKVVKNKCAPPFKAAEFDIMFGSGISSLGCLLDAAEGVGVVQRKGAWYSFGEQRIGQGREKSMAALTENSQLAKDIEEKTRQRLAGEVDINDLVDDPIAASDLAEADESDIELEEEEM